ncbi:MAG TPA: RcnB family protein [Steroidobacteraceae bacterium]|jgi:Ni/Co efflux regulator RcnB
MKRTVLAAMMLSLLTGTAVALADPPHGYGHDHDRQDQRHDEHRDEYHDEHRHEHHDRGEHRGEMRHEHEEHEHFDSGRYDRPRGWHGHYWRRGERLPPDYRGPAYVIPDPVVYRLRPPPPGYYWVRVDNNAVLAVVATGVVVDVAVNLFH